MARLPRVLLALALSTGLSSFPAARPSQQAPTFKSGARVVPIYATVTDADRRLVPGLTRGDFDIFDNDRPQALSLFDNEVQPITVVVMLDTSASMTLNIDFVQA